MTGLISGIDPELPELSSVGVPVLRRCDFSSSTAARRVSVIGGDACGGGEFRSRDCNSHVIQSGVNHDEVRVVELILTVFVGDKCRIIHYNNEGEVYKFQAYNIMISRQKITTKMKYFFTGHAHHTESHCESKTSNKIKQRKGGAIKEIFTKLVSGW